MWCKMFKNAVNSKKQGDIGLGNAIQYFSSMGYTVLLPLTDSQDYDLAIDDETGIKKVQVKTTSYKTRNNTYEVGLKMQGGNSKKNKIHKLANEIKYDILFVLTSSGERYIIPKEDIKNIKSSICLGTVYDKYKIR